jgi:hypothetical protein
MQCMQCSYGKCGLIHSPPSTASRGLDGNLRSVCRGGGILLVETLCPKMGGEGPVRVLGPGESLVRASGGHVAANLNQQDASPSP